MPDMPAHTSQFTKKKNKTILILKPRLNGSWFLPNDKETDSDTIGCWPSDTKFPTVAYPTKSPKSYLYKPPKGITDFEYDNPAIKKFMDAPPLNSPSLDHSVFQNPSKAINFKKSIHPSINACIKKSLHEGFLGEELNDIALSLCSNIETEMNDPRVNTGTQLQCLKTVLMLIGHSLARDTIIKTNIHVVNTLSMRDKIFESFNIVPKTKNILRGTGFLSPGPFGPIPESLKDSLKSFNAKDFIAKAIPSTSYKRSYPNPHKGSNKSTKYDSYRKPIANYATNPYNSQYFGANTYAPSQDKRHVKGKQNFPRPGFPQKNPKYKKSGN